MTEATQHKEKSSKQNKNKKLQSDIHSADQKEVLLVENGLNVMGEAVMAEGGEGILVYQQQEENV